MQTFIHTWFILYISVGKTSNPLLRDIIYRGAQYTIFSLRSYTAYNDCVVHFQDLKRRTDCKVSTVSKGACHLPLCSSLVFRHCCDTNVDVYPQNNGHPVDAFVYNSIRSNSSIDRLHNKSETRDHVCNKCGCVF